MPDYDRSKLAQWARELGFVRDTLEKVLRLSDVLVLDFEEIWQWQEKEPREV